MISLSLTWVKKGICDEKFSPPGLVGVTSSEPFGFNASKNH